jgi:hypothetical protein
MEMKRDLGGGRIAIRTENDVEAVVEVAPDLPNRGLLVPGHTVWGILQDPRFDREAGTLVLKAIDLEEHYIDEKLPRLSGAAPGQ